MKQIIKQIIDERFNSREILKRQTGFIVELVDDGYYAKVRVNNSVIKLINKTGEQLNIGDEVVVHYWTNVGNGYIAVRCGEPNVLKGEYMIDDAVVVDDNDDFDYVKEVHMLNTSPNISKIYGTNLKDFYLNGYPATYIPQDVYYDIADESGTHDSFKNFVLDTPDDKFFKEMILKSVVNVNYYGDEELHDIRYYLTIDKFTFTDSGWKKTYGLYYDNPDVYWHYTSVFGGEVLDSTPKLGIDDSTESNPYHSPTFQGLRQKIMSSGEYDINSSFTDSSVGIALYHNGCFQANGWNPYMDRRPFANIDIVLAVKMGSDIMYDYLYLSGNFSEEAEYNYARGLTSIVTSYSI